MSTYNGEKFLKGQIDSILNQKDVQCDILIRDDGSKDATTDLIREAMKQYPQRLKLLEGDNEGYKRSFMNLVYKASSDYDYYAFADQDDIWLSNKVKMGIRSLTESSHTPSLYYAMMTEVDENLNKLSNQQEFKPTPNYKEIIFQNFVQGSTIIFNKALLKLVKSYKIKEEVPHDIILPILAKYCGQIIGDRNSYILYRKHASAVTVKMKNNYAKELLKEAFSDYKLTNYANILLAGYKDYIKDKYIPYLKVVKNYRKLSNKIALVNDSNVRKFSLKGTVMLKLAIIFNKLLRIYI